MSSRSFGVVVWDGLLSQDSEENFWNRMNPVVMAIITLLSLRKCKRNIGSMVTRFSKDDEFAE